MAGECFASRLQASLDGVSPLLLLKMAGRKCKSFWTRERETTNMTKKDCSGEGTPLRVESWVLVFAIRTVYAFYNKRHLRTPPHQNNPGRGDVWNLTCPNN